MGEAALPERLVKLVYVVGALLLLPLLGAFLWGALGGTHQTYRLGGDDEELNSMTPRVACREFGREAEVDEGMLPEGWWFTVAKEEMAAPRGKPTCPNCLRPDLTKLENRKLRDD